VARNSKRSAAVARPLQRDIGRALTNKPGAPRWGLCKHTSTLLVGRHHGRLHCCCCAADAPAGPAGGKIRLKHYSILTEDAYVDWLRCGSPPGPDGAGWQGDRTRRHTSLRFRGAPAQRRQSTTTLIGASPGTAVLGHSLPRLLLLCLLGRIWQRDAKKLLDYPPRKSRYKPLRTLGHDSHRRGLLTLCGGRDKLH